MNESSARRRHLAEHGCEPDWARVGLKRTPPEPLGVLRPSVSSGLVRQVVRMRDKIIGKAPKELVEAAQKFPPIVSRRQRRKNWRESRTRVFLDSPPFEGTHRQRAEEHRTNWPVVVAYGADHTATRWLAFFQALGGKA